MSESIRTFLSVLLATLLVEATARAEAGTANAAGANSGTPPVALHMSPLAPMRYDSSRVGGIAGPPYEPRPSTKTLIDAGAFKLQLQSDGMGHSHVSAPALKGATVNGSGRNGGGFFKFSWPTTTR